MERVFAARDGRTAQRGCYYGGGNDHPRRASASRSSAWRGRVGAGRRRSAHGAADDGRRSSCRTGSACWCSSACSARRCPPPTAPSSSSRSCSPATSSSAGGRRSSRTRQLLRLSRLMAHARRRRRRRCVAYLRPEPGILLIVAFDIVLCRLRGAAVCRRLLAEGEQRRRPRGDRRRHHRAADRALRDTGCVGRPRHARAAGAQRASHS